MNTQANSSVIALYIGDALYSTASNPPSAVEETIRTLQASPLTCPISLCSTGLHTFLMR
jgi:hypothetical protein